MGVLKKTLEIRRATVHDVESMAELLAMLFAQETEFSPDKNRQVTALNELLSNSRFGIAFVAERESCLLGMVVILYTLSSALGGRVGILEDMVVAPKERGAGVGRLLITRALDQARADGCKRITLLTDSNNIAAQRFYDRFGFTRSAMAPFRLNTEILNPD